MADTNAVEVILSFPSLYSLRCAQMHIFDQCGADRKNDYGIIPGSRYKLDYRGYKATVLVTAREEPYIRDKIYALAENSCLLFSQ